MTRGVQQATFPDLTNQQQPKFVNDPCHTICPCYSIRYCGCSTVQTGIPSPYCGVSIVFASCYLFFNFFLFCCGWCKLCLYIGSFNDSPEKPMQSTLAYCKKTHSLLDVVPDYWCRMVLFHGLSPVPVICKHTKCIALVGASGGHPLFVFAPL